MMRRIIRKSATEREGMDILTLIFGILSAMIMLFIHFETRDSSDVMEVAFSEYSLYHVAFASIGTLSILFVNGFRIKTSGLSKIGYSILFALILLIISTIVELIVIEELERAAVRTTILGLYFLFAAVTEELFFRGAMIAVPARLLNWNPPFNEDPFNFVNKRKSRRTSLSSARIGILISLSLISSIVFGIAHESSYGERPAVMVALGIEGFMWAIYILLFGNINTVIFTHFFKNSIAFYQQFGHLLILR